MARVGEFYTPDDQNSSVALRARCDFLCTVLKHEPDVLPRLVNELRYKKRELPHWDSQFDFDMLAINIVFLDLFLEWRKKHCSGRWLTILDEEIEQKVQHVATIRHLTEEDARAFIFPLVDFYRKTCLRKVGPGMLSLLMRFVVFCFYKRRDLQDYEALYDMTAHRPWDKVYLRENDPLFRFSLIDWRDYIGKLAAREDTKHLKWEESPSWLFDDESETYISYQISLVEEPPSVAAERINKAQREAWAHHQQRREAMADVKTFTGDRRGAASGDHWYWLYLYSVKEMDTNAIAALIMEQRPDVEVLDEVLEPSTVEKAIKRKAKLAHIDLVPFGKRRERLKESEVLET